MQEAAKDVAQMPDEASSRINQHSVALYSLLVDQMHRYHAIFWQFPVALIAANLFGVEKFAGESLILLLIALLDFVLLYAFYVSIVYSRDVIAAAQRAEEAIKLEYPAFIPDFTKRKIRVTYTTLSYLTAMAAVLLVYALLGLYGEMTEDPETPC